MEKSRFRFFLPNARILKSDEIAELPPEKREAAKTSGEPGLWIEVDNLEESSIDEKGNITIPAKGAVQKEKGTFFNLFCPEGSCEVLESTDLP